MLRDSSFNDFSGHKGQTIHLKNASDLLEQPIEEAEIPSRDPNDGTNCFGIRKVIRLERQP